MTLQPQNNLFEDEPMTPRGQERVRDTTGTDVEGAPTEEGLDSAQVDEQVEDDPTEESNFTEDKGLNPDDFAGEGEDLPLAERDPDQHAEDR